MTQDFQDITWLAGQVFLFRDFVKNTDARGLDEVFARCPYGDLTDEQKSAYRAAFNNPRLRQVVEQWWATYDQVREKGEIEPLAYWSAG